MSDIVDVIEKSFKELLKDKVYRSITVKDICEASHISRNTFYSNFRDKRAIVAYLINRDCIAPIERVNELLSPEQAAKVAPSIVAKLYEGVYADRDYYSDLVPAMCGVDPTFELVVSRAVYRFILKVVPEDMFLGEEGDRKAAAYYFAAGQAISLEKWIADRYKMPIPDLAKMEASMLVSFWAPRTGVQLPDDVLFGGRFDPKGGGLL